MKFSVVVNSKGEIVAASIPNDGRIPVSVAGPRAMDELRLPDGHSMHELNMPTELAEAFLGGKFNEAFQNYTLMHEGGKPTLKKK
jgi:hypothetical protein